MATTAAIEQSAVAAVSAAVAGAAITAGSLAPVATKTAAPGRDIGATGQRHHQHNTVHAYLLQV
jgi:hypothetical protein